MTKEEAIEIMSRPFSMADVPEDILAAHKMAIKVLEQEPPTGHWINTGYIDQWRGNDFICSECGTVMLGRSNYCHNCGAKMQMEDNEDDIWS